MADLQAAFAKSRQKLSGNSAAIRGNLVLKVSDFTETTVKGIVLTGLHAGSKIEVAYSGTLKQKDYQKKSGKSFVDIAKGGSLRVEGVKEGKDGVLAARWMVTFNGKPKVDAHTVIPDAVCGFVDTGRKDGEGRPKLRINHLIIDNEVLVSTMDDLQTAIEKCYAEEGAVMLYGTDENGQVIQAPFTLSGQLVDGKWAPNDATTRATETIESFGDATDQVKAVLAAGGFSVVPMRGYSVGPTTAEMMETTLQEAQEQGTRARISTVDPQNWQTPTMGMRLQSAFLKTGANDLIPKEVADKLTVAFKAYADKDETATFAKGGWRELSDDTITKFFASADVALVSHPASGWATQALLEDRFDGMDRGFIVKGFQLKSSSPYPAVAACAEARENYYSEMKNSIEAVVANLRVESTLEKDAPKAKVVSEAESLPVDDGDDLDDVLNNVMDDLGPES